MSVDNISQINFDIPQTCKAAGISRPMLYKLWKLKKGPAITKIGRRIFVSPSALKSWLKQMEVDTKKSRKKNG
jgi:predicted DNA-binding transcriptional regulator AlpA